MNKFLIRMTAALSIVVLIHAITLVVFGNGKIDGFYLRFTTPSQHSLVLGNSRAAQAIVPQILDSAFEKLTFQGPVFNYGFSLSTSPYGSFYLESIKKKLDPSTKNGLFILAVDPWSISRESNIDEKDTNNFYDAKTLPYNMKFVNVNPNIEFLLKNYYSAWGDMIIANILRTTQMELHSDGWLEVTVPMNDKRHEQRIKGKIKLYRTENFYSKTFSLWRLEYLKKTIRFLKRHGEVFLVRIPLDPRLADVEYEYMPQFDDLMYNCAIENDVSYLNYFPDNPLYKTTDGNHLYKGSAKQFTKKLAEDIKGVSKL